MICLFNKYKKSVQKRTDFFDNSFFNAVPDKPLATRNKPHNNQLCADLSRFISAYPVVSHFLRFAWQTTSTMLHILGCLDSQTKGKYFLGEYEVCKYSSNTIAEIRNEEIGFVLQNFGLLSDKSVYENISYPLIFNPAVKYKMMKKLITKAAEDMLVSDLLKKPVKELSGGQKQRVALARAIVNRPNIILADEPTAALDKNTANDIMNVLINLNKNGKTVVIVTHDRSVAEKCNRIIELSDGEIISDKENIPA